MDRIANVVYTRDAHPQKEEATRQFQPRVLLADPARIAAFGPMPGAIAAYLQTLQPANREPTHGDAMTTFLLPSSPHMRAAAILGLGCSAKDLKPFQTDSSVEWLIGVPSADDSVDAIVLFGGDGTIHRHLSQLVKLGLPLLVVPAGSGNDFARALGLKRVRDSLAAWQKFCKGVGNVCQIDLGTITPLAEPEMNPASAQPPELENSGSPKMTRCSVLATRYFACVASIGFDSEVTRLANQLPRWLRGHGGYALSIVPALVRLTPVRTKLCTLEPAATQWALRSDNPTTLAAFANAPLYGGGMNIAPRAKMDDGLLDLCIIEGIGAFKLFRLFPTVYSGRHLQIKEVHYFQSTRAHVETERPMDVYADGEYVCRTPVEVSVERKALRVIGLEGGL